MLSLKFTPTKTDLSQALQEYQLSSLPTLILILVLCLPIFGCSFFSILRNSQGSTFGILLLLIILFVLAFILYIILIAPQKTSDRMDKAGMLNQPITYEISETGVTNRTEISTSQMGWKKFQKLIETKHHFLLILTQNAQMFLYIPKRVFETENDMNWFRKVITSHIPQSNRPFYQALPRRTIIWLMILGTPFILLLLAIAFLIISQLFQL